MSHFAHFRLAPLGLAVAAALCAMPALAQDSGVGVDLHFGNALNPTGTSTTACSPQGTSLIIQQRKRTPSGQLYHCPPDLGLPRPVSDGEWQFVGSLGIGYLYLNNEEYDTTWLRFNNWDDGVIGRLDLTWTKPKDGSYVDVRGNRINGDNQYYRINAGRAGHFKVEAFARSQVNVTNGRAKSIWGNVGSNALELRPGLTPAGSTIAEASAVSAAAPEQILKVVRDKFGVGINYYLNRQFTAYASASHEKREGARPFGGAFFFAYIFPGLGGVYEIPRPIDDTTVNFNAGLRRTGAQWNWDINYSGSFFRNGTRGFRYEVPFTFPALAPIPNYPIREGEFAYEPENDYHNLRGTLTRKLPMNGQFSVSASLSTSRQNDDLMAPMPASCSGRFGLQPPPLSAACADWNTTAALSRQRAGLAINSTLINAKLNLQPSPRVSVQGQFKYHRQDYEGTYLAYNPLTGEYGYIAENGAQGSAVPGEMGLWVPGSDILTRVRNLTLDKDIMEATFGADFRVNPKNTLSATATFNRTDYTHREVERQDNWMLKLGWMSRAIENMTLRVNYSYLDRNGRDYNYDPYEFTFSRDLPGFVDNGTFPHTVDALRKYDVGSRTQHKLTLIATYAATANATLSASLRGDWNDYDAEFGRQGYDTWGGSVQWDWQPSVNRSANLFFGYDRSNLDMANINDTATPDGDASVGGSNYQDANRWWSQDHQRNYYAGAGFNQRIGKSWLELTWNYSDSRGLTHYRFNSAGALASPGLVAAVGNGFDPMTFRINTVTLAWTIPLHPRADLRIFDSYETGRMADWHYSGLDAGLVTSNRVYLGGGAGDYSVNMLGVMVEVKL